MASTATEFGTVNWIVLIVYLILIFVVGSLFARRQRSTGEFFKSSGQMNWFLVAISMVAGLISAISYLSLPARVFKYDASYAIYPLAILLVTPLATQILLPFYRRLNITTAYEYLEKRFNLNIRLMASALFICKRLFWMALIALAPSLALSVFTGIRVEYCIIIIGAITTVYTGLGGMSGVIWTEAIQFLIFMAGQFFILLSVGGKLDGGMVEIFRSGWENHKLTMNMSFDWSNLTFWTMLIAGAAIALAEIGSDQIMVQRMMVTPDIRAARKSLWLNAIIKIPATILLLIIGAAMWVYYHHYPERLALPADDYEKIVPFFVVSEIPPGLAGLVIASIFAASMSGFASGLTSLVTAFTVDWYERILRPGQDDHRYLRWAKGLTFTLGFAVTLLAILIYWAGIKSIIDASNTYQGFFGGGLLGLFLLGTLTRRAKALPCVLGVLIGVAAVIVIDQYQIRSGKTFLHPYLFCLITTVITMVVGFFGSYIGPALPFEKIKNYTLAKKPPTL